MYENSDTANKTENYTFEKIDTNYVKYLPSGASMFAAGNSLCLVGYEYVYFTK